MQHPGSRHVAQAGNTAPVGDYWGCASPSGAMDLVGNAWEWVADWYDAGYYDLGVWDNPVGPVTGERRVIRGSSWNSNAGGAGRQSLGIGRERLL